MNKAYQILLLIILSATSHSSAQERVPTDAFCQYDTPPVLMQAAGSHACGESSPKDGPFICVARMKCSDGKGNMKGALTVCDAMSDGTCPSASFCNKDSAWKGIKFAQVAKDDSVKDFWIKRDALAERRRQEQATTHRSQTDHSSPSSPKSDGSR